MMSFRENLEASAALKGQFKIPERLSDAQILNRTGWAWWELRTTPDHIIEELLFIWHLEQIAEKAAARG